MKHLVYTTSSFSKKKHFLEGLEQKNICKKQISEVNTLQPTLVDTEWCYLPMFVFAVKKASLQ